MNQHTNKSHLVSLTVQAIQQQAPSTLVSPAHFEEISSYFQMKKKPSSTPQPQPTPVELPKEDNKKERFLPIPCSVVTTDIQKTVESLSLSNTNLFTPQKEQKRWGALSYLSNNQELTTFIDAITQAITTKLAIPLASFSGEDEHLHVKLRAASTELSSILVFGEPHQESSIKKQLLKIPGCSENEPGSSYPLLHFLAALNKASFYFIPLLNETRNDIQAKKKLWTSLQTLSL